MSTVPSPDRARPDLRDPRPGSENENLRRSVGRGDLVEEVGSTTFHADHLDTLLGENGLQAGSHHSSVPRPPVDRHDAASVPLGGFGLCHLVQDFIGCRVVDLSSASETRGRGREQHHRLERVLPNGFQHRAEPADFGLVDLGEIIVALVLDGSVGKDAGSVYEPRDGSVFLD